MYSKDCTEIQMFQKTFSKVRQLAHGAFRQCLYYGGALKNNAGDLPKEALEDFK